MADVFLSYRNLPERKRIVGRLATILRAHDISVWWDYGLEAGASYRDQIAAELASARVVVPVWCEESVRSEWVRMEAELGKAKLLPVRLQAVTPPPAFEAIHSAHLEQWNGSILDPRLGAFIDALLRRLEKSDSMPADMKAELAALPTFDPLPAPGAAGAASRASPVPRPPVPPSRRGGRSLGPVLMAGGVMLAVSMGGVALFIALQPETPPVAEEVASLVEAPTAEAAEPAAPAAPAADAPVQPVAPANDPPPADAALRPDRPGVVLTRPQIEALSEAVRNRPAEGLPKLDATRIVPADCTRQIPPNIIYFEYDAAALNAAARESLNTFAKKLLASGCRLREVRIDGHDERAASDAYSVRLSERRAKAAADVLVAAGIPVAVLQVNALGASQLAVQTDPGVREAANRRVEVWVTTASR